MLTTFKDSTHFFIPFTYQNSNPLVRFYSSPSLITNFHLTSLTLHLGAIEDIQSLYPIDRMVLNGKTTAKIPNQHGYKVKDEEYISHLGGCIKT